MIRWVEPVEWTTTALDELRAKVAREALRAPEELVRKAAEVLGVATPDDRPDDQDRGVSG